MKKYNKMDYVFLFPGQGSQFSGMGKILTEYDVIGIEDAAYLGMDYRQDYSVPGRPPFIPTIARYSDNYFHEAQVQTSPIALLVKYKAEADSIDLDEDITFVLQDQFIYAIDSSDFDDPNILNVMSYNIKLMPLVATDFFERGSLFPSKDYRWQSTRK